jgi:SAM-dependent methyltransferase
MNDEPVAANQSCHNCNAAPLKLACGYKLFRRVTSDCKPWPDGGRMGVCPVCGLVQAVTDAKWVEESRQIYSSYDIYYQSGGIEQTVFDPATGRGRARSDVIVEGLMRSAKLANTGRLLDIGCGNGAFLRSSSRALPGWSFCGSEFDLRHRAAVEVISGVEGLYSGPLSEIPGEFDVISLIHVLEHIPAPTALLKQVATKLKPGGWLVVEVPDCRINPFMLLVADHASHFSPGALSVVAGGAGFEVLQADDAWVAKEISLLARKPVGNPPSVPLCPPAEAEQTYNNWKFLNEAIAQAEALQSRGALGLFGTSIGATWLDAQLRNTAAFFVDEDPHRIGKQHEGRSIHAVKDIPTGANVFIVLPTALAKRIAERLQSIRPDVNFVTP